MTHNRVAMLETLAYMGNDAYRIPVPPGMTVEQAWTGVKDGKVSTDENCALVVVIVTPNTGHILRHYP